MSRRLLCSVRFVFVSTFILQRGTAFVVGITNLSKQAVCERKKILCCIVAILLSTDAAARLCARRALQRRYLKIYDLLFQMLCRSFTYRVQFRKYRRTKLISNFLNHPVYQLDRGTGYCHQKVPELVFVSFCGGNVLLGILVIRTSTKLGKFVSCGVW